MYDYHVSNLNIFEDTYAVRVFEVWLCYVHNDQFYEFWGSNNTYNTIHYNYVPFLSLFMY